MPYASNADVEQRLGTLLYVQLTDDAGTGVADEAKVTAALAAAQAEMNSYLARRYLTPIDAAGEPDVEAILRSIALDITEYRLHARRPPVPADVASRQAAAIAWLQRVAEGKALLPAAGELPANTSSGPSCAVSGAERVWRRDEIADL